MLETDRICEQYAGNAVGLTLRMLPRDEDAVGETILIQGSAEALKFLTELLLAVANEPENDGFGIGPYQAGSAHFGPEATHGLYIHRLD